MFKRVSSTVRKIVDGQTNMASTFVSEGEIWGSDKVWEQAEKSSGRFVKVKNSDEVRATSKNPCNA
jgi:hypothetical protein